MSLLSLPHCHHGGNKRPHKTLRHKHGYNFMTKFRHPPILPLADSAKMSLSKMPYSELPDPDIDA